MIEREGNAVLEKCPSGIQGLDEITDGGLPKGRPTLVCGAAGCGKTVLGMEFLVRGALQYNEPGVFVSFEETIDELVKNFASLGFDINDMISRRLINIDHVHIERSEIEETGEYDLEGLFIRMGHAIDSIGAKRVVLDTIEALFSGLTNTAILRAELRRLLRWLKAKGVTVIISGERGENTLTRYGLEEYVADCVILLDFRVADQVSTRRLRIVKYRGSRHGADEYPFLIGKHGLSFMPITSLGLDYPVSNERISSGIPRLDAMLGGQGYFRGTSILISGTPGTGKTSLSANFAQAACMRGERCLYLAFEESAHQIMRNMRSIGLDLKTWVDKDLLRFHAARPTQCGLELHLLTIQELVNEFKPHVVVIDPISNLIMVGSIREVRSLLTRLIDNLKSAQVTALFTDLTAAGISLEHTREEISSLMDTWLLVRDIEIGGERNRGLYVLKSRGMAHSNQIREFLITDQGINLQDVYIGTGGVLTGSARVAQEALEKTAALVRQEEVERKQRELERRRQALEAQMKALSGEIEAVAEEIQTVTAEDSQREMALTETQTKITRFRMADKES
jgi:circadian clock protein KaiC